MVKKGTIRLTPLRERFSDEEELQFLNHWLNAKVEAEEYEIAQLIKNRIDYLKRRKSIVPPTKPSLNQSGFNFI